ncbi:hypothetical protein D3C76_1302180 [compost metagenome]
MIFLQQCCDAIYDLGIHACHQLVICPQITQYPLNSRQCIRIYILSIFHRGERLVSQFGEFVQHRFLCVPTLQHIVLPIVDSILHSLAHCQTHRLGTYHIKHLVP